MPYQASSIEEFFSDIEKLQDPSFANSEEAEFMIRRNVDQYSIIVVPRMKKTGDLLGAYSTARKSIAYYYRVDVPYSSKTVQTHVDFYDSWEDCEGLEFENGVAYRDAENIRLWFLQYTCDGENMLLRIHFPTDWPAEMAVKDVSELHEWFTFELYKLNENNKVVLVDDDIFED